MSFRNVVAIIPLKRNEASRKKAAEKFSSEKFYMEEKQTRFLASAPQKVDNAIHRINHYPAGEHWQNQLGYPVDCDLNVDSAIHTGAWSLVKLVPNAVPESTRKSTKYAVNVFEGEESYEKPLQILSYANLK